MTAYWHSVEIVKDDGTLVHKFTHYDLHCMGMVDESRFTQWCNDNLFKVLTTVRDGCNLTVCVA